MTTYDDFLTEARQIKTKILKADVRSDKLRLELLMLLVEMHHQEVVWRTQHSSWRALLKTERLTSYSTFQAFDMGFRLMGLKGVEDYGVTAICAIQRSPTSYRRKIIKDVRVWFDAQKHPPSHKEVSRYIWRRRRDLAPDEFTSRGRLLTYIGALKEKLKAHGIRPPRMK